MAERSRRSAIQEAGSTLTAQGPTSYFRGR